MEKTTQEIKEEEKKTLEKNRKIFKQYFSFFAVTFFVIASFFFGYEKGKNDSLILKKNIPLEKSVLENKENSSDVGIDFSLFWNTWDLLKKNHIDKDKINAQKLVYGAIRGMLKATEDPYTDFFDPDESKEFNQNIEGVFEGIGAELGMKDEILTIVAPLKGSPAEEAGLRAGDKILKIDGKISTDFTIDEAADLIRGKKGTNVKLTILHNDAEETEEIVVTRGEIELDSVEIEFIENRIAHVKIIRFSENVDTEFNEAINSIIKNKSRGIILDLRNNPGGLLDKTIVVASKMIPKNKVVVSEENGHGQKKDIFTLGGDKISSLPMVVLIDEGSASASEILAGALRDNQEVTLIGKKSFGKGSVQQLFDLPGGSNVKITVSKWLTPNGEYIMEKGIQPDIEVDLTLEDFKNDKDPQLDRAIEEIKNKINVVE